MTIILPPELSMLPTYKTKTWAHLYSIERTTDGEALLFTNHDAEIVFDDETYSPIGGPDSESFRSEAGARPSTFSILAPISTGLFDADDLRYGLFRDAVLRIRIVNWRYPFAGALRTHVGTIEDIEYSGEYFKANCSTLAAEMQRNIGRLHTRLCDHKLGHDVGHNFCAANVASKTFTAVVTASAGFTNANKRLRFRSTLTTVDGGGLGDHYYKYGVLTWTTTANGNELNGINSFEVKRSFQSQGELELALPTQFDIAIGDTFSVSAGCDRNKGTCASKWNQVSNYGGEPYMPAPDRYINPGDNG